MNNIEFGRGPDKKKRKRRGKSRLALIGQQVQGAGQYLKGAAQLQTSKNLRKKGALKRRMRGIGNVVSGGVKVKSAEGIKQRRDLIRAAKKELRRKMKERQKRKK